MTGEMEALARRAVACKRWRWMHGMSNSSGEVIDCVDVETGKAYCGEWDADITALPDFQDPATLGCLLALVRKAWCDPHASVWYDSEYWQSGNRWAWHAKGQSRVDYASEAEALVAALEAAP